MLVHSFRDSELRDQLLTHGVVAASGAHLAAC
jgi:hypothetical protein